jgi:hypothetical protein
MKKSNNSWFFGILLGLGVGTALANSLDNPAVGIAVGIGVAAPFVAGLYRRNQDD